MNSDESDYRHDVNRLVSWCDNNNLQLNAFKTRGMIVDFRKKKTPIAPIIINGEPTQKVDCFKFLGTIISMVLGWENNTDAVVKKAQQRLYFLRQVKKFGLRWEIRIQFCRSAIDRSEKRAGNIVSDQTHPAHRLFDILEASVRKQIALEIMLK